MPCEKSRIIKARSPPARILEILSFSKFNREDYYFADNQIHIFGRYDKRNRGNGRILHAIRRTGTTGKAQPLERNAAAYLIGKLKRKRDRLCKPCRRSSFCSHTTRDEKQIHTATTNYEFGRIDDYNGEKILFLDEFRSSFKISEILDYLDGQPIRIRGRHYNRVACYDTVYIVSNLSLKEQYTNIQQSEPKTWAAFCRRITAVYDFDKSKDIPVNKFTGELKKPPTLIEIADDGDIPF